MEEALSGSDRVKCRQTKRDVFRRFDGKEAGGSQCNLPRNTPVPGKIPKAVIPASCAMPTQTASENT